jgi:predicted phage terminase large subunit-like protein
MNMSFDDPRILNAILRQDFGSFVHRCMLTLNQGAEFLPNWHLDAITYQLQRVRAGEVTRLIINLPPRYLKSIVISVAFPAFVLGHDPNRRIFGISYGMDLATKHAKDFRAIVQSDWYRRAFPGMRIARATDTEVLTTERGFRKATSVGATVTGLGGHMFIIDDPQKPADAQSEARRNKTNQWYSNTLLSRLDPKATGVIVLVMQRVHLHDLTGHLLEEGRDWTLLRLPAIAQADEHIAIGDGKYHQFCADNVLHPQYESREVLEKLRRQFGSDIFSAQYLQTPVPPGGGIIKRKWLRYYDKLPERTYRTKLIQSWDTAAKAGEQNDWSVCTTWLVADDHYYLIDLVRGRYEYPQLKATAIALAKRDKPDAILIEEASTGIALAQELSKIVTRPVRPIPVERDKLGRLYPQQALFEARLVLFPKNAPFLPELETELLTFPQGKTDDQVDSISQALAYKPVGSQHIGWT